MKIFGGLIMCFVIYFVVRVILKVIRWKEERRGDDERDSDEAVEKR